MTPSVLLAELSVFVDSTSIPFAEIAFTHVSTEGLSIER